DGHLDDLDVRHVADTVEWCRQMARQLAAGQRRAVVWMVIAACIAGSAAVAVGPAASLGVLGAGRVTLRSGRVPESLPKRRSSTNGKDLANICGVVVLLLRFQGHYTTKVAGGGGAAIRVFCARGCEC